MPKQYIILYHLSYADREEHAVGPFASEEEAEAYGRKWCEYTFDNDGGWQVVELGAKRD